MLDETHVDVFGERIAADEVAMLLLGTLTLAAIAVPSISHNVVRMLGMNHTAVLQSATKPYCTCRPCVVASAFCFSYAISPLAIHTTFVRAN